jgi:hypothetical protein
MHIFPHPLDFDWRFERATIESLCRLLGGYQRVLALGAPSVAEALENLGFDVTLIDRQPERRVSKQVVADIDLLIEPRRGFDVAIVDPPWYSDQLLHWASYAASCVGPGGTVLATAWPSWTRPTAANDLGSVVALLSQWSEVQRSPIDPWYEIPRFERLAIEASNHGPLSASPRTGVLLELSVTHSPPPLAPIERPNIWQRFVINDYQLALRLTFQPVMVPKLYSSPQAIGWRWPFVSARAPGRSGIDLWSSDNEVACVHSAAGIESILRRALSTDGPEAFEQSLSPLPDLLAWSIPRPPYQRLITWQHQQ